MSEACRLCLEGPLESFQDMSAYLKELSFILPEIDVSLTEGPIICSRCSDLLLTAYSFKCNCLKIEEELKERISQAVCVVPEGLQEEVVESKDVKGERYGDETIRRDAKRFSCKYCDGQFKDRRAWNEHLETHTGSRHNCATCCVGFAARAELSRHKKLYHAGYECDVCGRKFLYRAVLSRHEREHASGRDHFECDVCGVKKRMKFQLTEHMRVHTGERPYKCGLCPKSFGQGSTLSTHVRSVHLTERPFVCEVCGKRYAVRGQYTRHVRGHAGAAEKPFACAHCGRAYAIRSKLQRHARRHTGEKPMVCHCCSKRFADKSDLNRHLLTHTGERRHQCPICRKRFGRKGNMDVHVKSCSRRHSTKLLVGD